MDEDISEQNCSLAGSDMQEEVSRGLKEGSGDDQTSHTDTTDAGLTNTSFPQIVVNNMPRVNTGAVHRVIPCINLSTHFKHSIARRKILKGF